MRVAVEGLENLDLKVVHVNTNNCVLRCCFMKNLSLLIIARIQTRRRYCRLLVLTYLCSMNGPTCCAHAQ